MNREFEGRSVRMAKSKAAEALGVAPEDLTLEVVRVEGGFLGAETSRVTIRAHSGKAGDGGSGAVGEPSAEGAARDANKPRLSVDEIALMTESILKDMGLDVACMVVEDEGDEAIEIEGADLGLVAADDGKLLDALQLIVSLLVRAKVGWSQPVALECDGMRSDRDEEIRQLAEDAAERALRTGITRLPPLNSYERRIVHVTLGERTDVTTRSEGEGALKRVVVRRTRRDAERGGGAERRGPKGRGLPGRDRVNR